MAFNIALSGIQAASSELEVLGNNIANGSTTGFKKSDVTFADLYASSALGTSSNAIGSGVRLAAVNQSFSQGTVNFTNNSLDVAVNGQGFFRLNDGGAQVYTRAGNFSVDREGFIVSTTGSRLTGFLADGNGTITGAQGDLQINSSNLSPQATTNVNADFNLPAQALVPPTAWTGSPNFGDPPPAPDTYNNVTSTTIFDSLGNSHILSIYFIKSNTANEWDVRAQVDGVDVDSAPAAAPFTQAFDAAGAFNAAGSDAISISWSPLDENGNPNGATTPQVFDISMADSTQFGSPFAVQEILQDGFTTGRLDSIDIDSSGVLFGRYTNGQSLAQGQIMLTNFNNPNGLQPIGDTSWGETFSSGPPLDGTPGTASLGVLQSGALEDSNVDLTEELVGMILAQRNFQANAQVVSTSDQVTQTIINIRR